MFFFVYLYTNVFLFSRPLFPLFFFRLEICLVLLLTSRVYKITLYSSTLPTTLRDLINDRRIIYILLNVKGKGKISKNVVNTFK